MRFPQRVVLDSKSINDFRCVAEFNEAALTIIGPYACFTVSAPRTANSLKINDNKPGVTLSISYETAWCFEISTDDSQRFKDVFDEWKINMPDAIGVGMPGRSVPGVFVNSSDVDL